MRPARVLRGTSVAMVRLPSRNCGGSPSGGLTTFATLCGIGIKRLAGERGMAGWEL